MILKNYGKKFLRGGEVNNIKSSTKLSARDYWETPQWLVDQLQELLMIGFVLDPCSTLKNKKAYLAITEEQDGLSSDWFKTAEHWGDFCRTPNSAIWVNPPFSQLGIWIDKVIEESQKGLTICLIHPDTPDPDWNQKIEDHCFLQLVPRNRLGYIHPETGEEMSSPPFPSCISVFNGMPKVSVQRVRFDLNKPSKRKSTYVAAA